MSRPRRGRVDDRTGLFWFAEFAGNNVGLGNFNVGAQLVNLRGLNPFFGTRTLTLIDAAGVHGRADGRATR